jgi:NADPH:quinone reductase-like Zn-dependent oxidoreductase
MRLPETTRAAAINRFGGPAVLKTRTLPLPKVGPSDVLIRVDTAGVGSWDDDMRAGWYEGRRPPFPRVLGVDGSGVVAAVGKRSRRFKTGERVYAYSFDNTKGGFYSEYVAVPAARVGRPPKGMSLRDAGALPATGLTAQQGIDEVLRLRRGETVVVFGASGAVGTLAVQFARRRGARVLAVASGRDGVALARKLGAHAAVDGRRGDVGAAVRAFAPKGVDAVLALAGGPELTAGLRAVRKGGRVAYPNGVEPAPRQRKGLRVIAYDARPGASELARLALAAQAARLRVPIAAEFPLARTRRAHERLARGHVLGRIVLRARRGRK